MAHVVDDGLRASRIAAGRTQRLAECADDEVRGGFQAEVLTGATPFLAEHTEAVVRPSAGVAYVPQATEEETDTGVERLLASIRAQLDPRGVLGA